MKNSKREFLKEGLITSFIHKILELILMNKIDKASRMLGDDPEYQKSLKVVDKAVHNLKRQIELGASTLSSLAK